MDVPFIVRVARIELVLSFAEAEEVGDAEAVAAADALVGRSDVFKVPERLNKTVLMKFSVRALRYQLSVISSQLGETCYFSV